LLQLQQHQHPLGTIPSNVQINDATEPQVSYGGLAGRVDALHWYVIGCCLYAEHMGDWFFWEQSLPSITRALALTEAWEFNHAHLMYVPLSGNWADEYLTHGYVLYDQLLRLWAMRLVGRLSQQDRWIQKSMAIENQLLLNFTPNQFPSHYHPSAYEKNEWKAYWPASFSPAGYINQFDAFANALTILLELPSANQRQQQLAFMKQLTGELSLQLVPAFWPVVQPSDAAWVQLEHNCKYEFRNHPFEFHNGGSWPMVNGFVGLSACSEMDMPFAKQLCEHIQQANALQNNSFYENFNSATGQPNGVPFCAWSAAAEVFLFASIQSNYKIPFK